MYLPNKYTKWYNNIIQSAKARIEVSGYTEKHHIIPKSLGGDNSKENLVRLTAREHFICHLLLTKMTRFGDRDKAIYAFHGMMAKQPKQQRRCLTKTKINSKLFSKLKTELSVIKSINQIGRVHTEESKRKMSESQKGKIELLSYS